MSQISINVRPDEAVSVGRVRQLEERELYGITVPAETIVSVTIGSAGICMNYDQAVALRDALDAAIANHDPLVTGAAGIGAAP